MIEDLDGMFYTAPREVEYLRVPQQLDVQRCLRRKTFVVSWELNSSTNRK